MKYSIAIFCLLLGTHAHSKCIRASLDEEFNNYDSIVLAKVIYTELVRGVGWQDDSLSASAKVISVLKGKDKSIVKITSVAEHDSDSWPISIGAYYVTFLDDFEVAHFHCASPTIEVSSKFDTHLVSGSDELDKFQLEELTGILRDTLKLIDQSVPEYLEKIRKIPAKAEFSRLGSRITSALFKGMIDEIEQENYPSTKRLNSLFDEVEMIKDGVYRWETILEKQLGKKRNLPTSGQLSEMLEEVTMRYMSFIEKTQY